MEQIITKICPVCNTEKNIQDFEKNKRRCKKCRNLQANRWYKENNERMKEQARERYKKDPKKYLERNKKSLNKEKKSEYMKEWHKANKDKVKDYYYKKLYGISISDFDSIYEKQNGGCAICREKKNKKDLCVDHNHESGEVRGLLCGKCNFGLGQFQDNISILKKAILYLTNL